MRYRLAGFFGGIALAASLFAACVNIAGAQTACYPDGHTGEGFPVVSCVDGTHWYQDMDGGRDRVPGTWVEMAR